MPLGSTPGYVCDGPKRVEQPHGHDIPLAREQLTHSLRILNNQTSTLGQLNHARSLIEEALRWMEPKVVRKTPGKSAVPITKAHEAKLEQLLKDGAFDRLTYAEIAVEVFGVPCHLGWLANKFSGRQK